MRGLECKPAARAIVPRRAQPAAIGQEKRALPSPAGPWKFWERMP